ncbi:MAG: DUF1848 domain-containing protein [Treponema sp.]|nr:DUF1848 domain-containing protein [Treponema sp.]
MIVNTGGRTDTVQYFSEWLLRRFREGFVYSRNPLFPEKVIRYELDPSVVDCVLFCSKNYAPILPRLHEITGRFNTFFHYTITAYGKDIEPGVPDIDTSIDTLFKLEKLVGRERIIWRYDPVLLTKKYTVQQHMITFGHMAARLSGHVSRCVFSFVEMYSKLQFNMPELIVLTEEDMEDLARGFGEIAAKYRIPIQTCATRTDYSRYGIGKSGCVTLAMIGKANGVKFRNLKHSGMRRGCGCMVSHDIGAYNTCPNGCRYCYANQNPSLAEENCRKHNPLSPILLGEVTPADEIVFGSRKSFLEVPDAQMELFDGL